MIWDNKRPITAGLLAAAALIGGGPAGAQQYFKGKTISVIVPSGGGSGLDTMARTVVDSWRPHIPGSPKVIIRNQPKGRGGKTLNFVYEKARPDGLTISWGSWDPAGIIAKKKGARHVPEKMGLIGGFYNPGFNWVRTDLAPGFKRSADIGKVKKTFSMGGRFAESTLDLLSNLTLDMMGAKYRFIAGYRGSSKIIPAALSGEIQGGTGGFPSFTRLKGSYIKEGKVRALWHHPLFNPDGTPQKRNFMPGTKSFPQVYKEAHGRLPSGPKWETYKWYMNTVVAMSLALLTPPGTPEAAMKDLRAGYNAMRQDPKFKALQKKRGVNLPALTVEQGLKILASYRNVPPAVKKELGRLGRKGK